MRHERLSAFTTRFLPRLKSWVSALSLYDSSVLIDYFDGDEHAATYVENHAHERAAAPPLVLFEVYQGEVFKSGPTDLAAIDRALSWLTVIDVTDATARAAAALQEALQETGSPLAARDAFIAGAAKRRGERLVVADADFDVEGITEQLDIEIL